MTVLHWLYYIVHTYKSRQSEYSVSLIAQLDESSDSWLEACVVIWQLRCGCNRCDRPRSCRSHLDHPPNLRWVRGILDPGCWMCSSHIRPARQGTKSKNICRMRHCLDWETVVVFGCARFSIFFSFLLQYFTLQSSVAECIFSMAYCSLPSVRNWKYAAYRGTSHVPAVGDDAGKEDTAIRCGMTLDGIRERIQGQTCKQTWWLQIVAYDIIRSAGLGLGKTSGNGKLCVDFSAEGWNKHILIQHKWNFWRKSSNPLYSSRTKCYGGTDINVSYCLVFFWILNPLFCYIRDVHREENVFVIDWRLFKITKKFHCS